MKMIPIVISILVVVFGLCLSFNPDWVMQLPGLKSYFERFTPEFLHKMKYFYRAMGIVAVGLGVWLLRLK
jgi:hypothetical protein